MKYKLLILTIIIIVLIIVLNLKKNENLINTRKITCANVDDTRGKNIADVSKIYETQSKAEFSNITTTDIFTKYFNSLSCKGIIVAWYDEIDKIPEGWGFCDGSTYKDLSGIDVKTPDLRSVSILGASKPDETTLSDIDNIKRTPKKVNDKGGEEAHTLTTNEAPIHTHPTDITFGSANNINNPAPTNRPVALEQDGEGCKSPPTSITGGGQPHNNMPPYIALAYIMKIY